MVLPPKVTRLKLKAWASLVMLSENNDSLDRDLADFVLDHHRLSFLENEASCRDVDSILQLLEVLASRLEENSRNWR